MPLDPFSVLGEDDDADLGAVADVPRETLRAFLLAVVLAQAGLFAVSLGAMLAWFRGQAVLGGGLVLAGAVALVATVGIIRRNRGN